MALVAAAAAILVGAGVFVVEEMRLRDHRIAVKDRDAQIKAVLTAPDAMIQTTRLAEGGSLTLVSSAERDSGVILFHADQAVGPNRWYHIWLIEGASTRAVSALGPFQVDVTLVVNGLRGMNVLGVTIEEKAAAQSPTLPLVAEIALS